MNRFWKGTIAGFVILILSYLALTLYANQNCVLSAVLSLILAQITQVNIENGRE